MIFVLAPLIIAKQAFPATSVIPRSTYGRGIHGISSTDIYCQNRKFDEVGCSIAAFRMTGRSRISMVNAAFQGQGIVTL